MKREKIETVLLLFDGNIQDVIVRLHSIIKDNPQYVNIFIETSYDGEYNIIGERTVNEKEEMDKKKAAIREKDLKLMEKLAKKHDCTIMINEYQ